ncbi:MAG: hypothetical protein ABJD11_03900 [Gemmatimonadota bacterium]
MQNESARCSNVVVKPVWIPVLNAGNASRLLTSALVLSIVAGCSDRQVLGPSGLDLAPVAAVVPISNEPSGMSLLSARAFNARVEDGWLDRGGLAFSVKPDATAPSSANIGSAFYHVGYVAGTAPINTWHTVPGNMTTIYLAFSVRLSPNWVGHSSGVGKIFHLWIGGFNRVVLSATGVGSAPLRARISLQRANIPGGSLNLDPYPAAPDLTRGVWHRWEVIAVANTGGQANGSIQWWVDGVPAGSVTGLNIVPANCLNRWTQVNWNPTWGGQLGTTLPASQTMDMDDVRLSAK